MVLRVTVDSSKLDKRLESMVKKIHLFPEEMSTELTDWQTQDMHRRYPNTEEHGNSVQTSIWPTSRLAAEGKKKTIIPVGMKGRIKKSGQGGVRSGAHRPILRPSLYETLKQRMAKLMEKLSWQ